MGLPPWQNPTPHPDLPPEFLIAKSPGRLRQFTCLVYSSIVIVQVAIGSKAKDGIRRLPKRVVRKLTGC